MLVGVVFSTRPEDSCIPLMEANITKFLKVKRNVKHIPPLSLLQEQGELERPEDHVTIALHTIDYLSGDNTKRPALSLPPITEADIATPSNEIGMAASDVSITFWQEMKDPKTNSSYYWNPSTNNVSWTLPANGVLTNEASERSDEIQDPEKSEILFPEKSEGIEILGPEKSEGIEILVPEKSEESTSQFSTSSCANSVISVGDYSNSKDEVPNGSTEEHDTKEVCQY